ncbi:MAG: transglycosylase SLT domain-containing protein [Sulfurovum sp.]|nr:transglycosylase SLT domain-containing protein [Sulfurovum sp.]
MMKKIVFLLLLLPLFINAINIPEKYPSYSYVLKEFDIDETYIFEPQFENFVAKNEARFKRFYRNSVKRGKDYMPMFKDLLVNDGLSHLFVYLSMTESGFQANAKSPMKAAGLWQFMSATAQRFGLKVNKHIDERYDPLASTNAAMKYIQILYKQFGKWYLVMMAYNCGEGRVAKAIRKAGTDDFSTLMDDKLKYIPLETRTYLKKIILLSMMGERIVTGKTEEQKEIKREIIDGKILVNVAGGANLLKFAEILLIKVSDFFDMNPHLTDYKISEDISLVQVMIPQDKFALYQAFYRPPTLEQIFKTKRYSNLVSHIVAKGDTIKSIARRYKTTPIDMIIANQLPSEKLAIGKLLVIPVTKDTFEKMIRY